MLSTDDLRILIETRTTIACLSLYMPVVCLGKEIEQNPIRLKNMLRTAEERLVQSGIHVKHTRKLLDPVHDLLDDEVFWRQQEEDGLALFRSPDMLKIYRLPLSLEEQIFVGYRFLVKPLLPLFNWDGQFYILALSLNQVRLLKGTRFYVQEINLEGLPENLVEVLAGKEHKIQLQSHPDGGVTTGGGRPTMMFHGNGPGTVDETEKIDILRYFQRIDRGLHNLMAEEKAPLVLAGVDYLHPLYHEVNHYQHLLIQGISGNPEEISDEELHRRAWELVQPIFEQQMEEVKALYKQHMGTGNGRASVEVREIVQAAYYGRVSQLFLQEGRERWGNFDPDTGDVSLHPEDQPSPEDMDVLDFAAAYTIINQGKVYILQPGQMPGSEPAVAVFRY